MGFFDKSEDEKLYDKAANIRDRIIDYISENIEYPAESNMVKFLSNHELPPEIYRKIGNNKRLLWGVKDALPAMMAKKFEYNFKRYYLNKAKYIKHEKAKFKKVNTVNSSCLTALPRK